MPRGPGAGAGPAPQLWGSRTGASRAPLREAGALRRSSPPGGRTPAGGHPPRLHDAGAHLPLGGVRGGGGPAGRAAGGDGRADRRGGRARELVGRIQERLRPETRRATHACAGTLPFPEFCALIEAADLTVTNNTGPMHVAAAVKTPVVALFALTNPPEQWGPWQAPHHLLYHDVPCRICYSRVCPYGHECLRLVTPDDVVAAAAELLGTGAGGRGGRRRCPRSSTIDVARTRRPSTRSAALGRSDERLAARPGTSWRCGWTTSAMSSCSGRRCAR